MAFKRLFKSINKKDKEAHEPDKSLIFALLAILILGMVMLFSASSVVSYTKFGNTFHYVLSQSVGLLVGLGLFFIASKIKYDWWKKVAGLMLFLSIILLTFIVPFADVPVERFGGIVLSLPPLQPVFNGLYQTPFVGLTRFNNTMVAGSVAAGLLAYIPVYLLVRLLLSVYRKKLQPLIVNSKLYKQIIRIPLVKKLTDASGIGGMKS